MKYLNGVPSKPLPDGQVVVHNFAPGDDKQRVGINGFRIWQDSLADGNYVACNCGWESDRLAEHYATPSRAVA